MKRNSRHLEILKKIDSSTSSVRAFSSYAVIYDFSAGKWSRAEIEGALFITIRTVQPFQRIVVINRIGLNNLIVDIDSDFEYELNKEFIMIKTLNSVKGIWFGKPADRALIYSALTTKVQHQNGDISKDPKKNLALSRKQLQTVLLDLVQDDSFIDMLHKRYTESIKH